MATIARVRMVSEVRARLFRGDDTAAAIDDAIEFLKGQKAAAAPPKRKPRAEKSGHDRMEKGGEDRSE